MTSQPLIQKYWTEVDLVVFWLQMEIPITNILVVAMIPLWMTYYRHKNNCLFIYKYLSKFELQKLMERENGRKEEIPFIFTVDYS